MNPNTLKSIKERLLLVSENAQEFLLSCDDQIMRLCIPVYAQGKNYYWDKLTPELKNESEKLKSEFIAIFNEVSKMLKGSALIGSEDFNTFRINVKTILSSLLLRSYSYREADVIHNEGSILGFTPATQNDNYPSEPRTCLFELIDAVDEIMRIVSLIDASDEEVIHYLATKSTPGYENIRKNTAFIMMNIDKSKPELIDVRDAIKEIFRMFRIKAFRADDIEHEDKITNRIIEEIKTSEFLIADLTGERPSVYYEVGYAHAIGKRVILYRKKDTRLHFDLADYNCPEYENLNDLKEMLKKRLIQMTNITPLTIQDL